MLEAMNPLVYAGECASRRCFDRRLVYLHEFCQRNNMNEEREWMDSKFKAGVVIVVLLIAGSE